MLSCPCDDSPSGDTRLLDQLPRAKDAAWSCLDRSACLEGTRAEELDEIERWMYDEAESRVYLITGLAGIGKTTIGNSVAQLADKARTLGASFFCSRDSHERSDLQLIIPTISFQLSQFSIGFRSGVLAALKRHPDAGHSRPEKQLEELVVAPMHTVTSWIMTSFKDKIGFGPSLTAGTIQEVLVEPLRQIVLSAMSKLEWMPDERKDVLASLHLIVEKLGRGIRILQETETRLRRETDEAGRYEKEELIKKRDELDTCQGEMNLSKAVLNSLQPLITTCKKGTVSMADHQVTKSIFSSLKSAESTMKTLEHRKSQSPTPSISLFDVSSAEIRSIIAMVENHRRTKFKSTIQVPLESIYRAVREAMTSSNEWPDDKFNASIIEALRRMIVSSRNFHGGNRLPNSRLSEQNVEDIAERLRDIVAPILTEFDLDHALPDSLLKNLILEPLRIIIMDINGERWDIDHLQLLQTTLGAAEKGLHKGRLLSDVGFRTLVTEALPWIEPFSLPVVVVIDALDECRGKTAPETILLLLSKHASTIPYLKFFAASRPEYSARYAVGDPLFRQLSKLLILHEVDRKRVDRDIELVFKARLADIAERRRRDNAAVPNHWPGESLVGKLVDKSGGLFIFADTICRFLECPGDLQEQLDIIANIPTNTREGLLGIDDLYQTIIDSAFKSLSDSQSKCDCRSVVGTIILLFNPLPATALARILNKTVDRVLGLLRDLHSVLLVPEKGGVQTFHASFHDFLTHKERCSEQIYVQPSRQHLEITSRLLQLMIQDLKQDICKINDLGQDTNTWQQRKQTYIGKPLIYACRYWVEHLSSVSPSENGTESLILLLEEFLRTKLFYWMEVLGLEGCIATAAISCDKIRKWYLV